MKKVYIAGKFNLNKDKTLPLSERLINDFRSLILGDSKLMTFYNDKLMLNDNYQYMGPFYCEQASNGDFTSTDCNVVLETEYKAVQESDMYIVVFDQSFSVGSIVELSWAISMDKEIIIFYQNEDSVYQIKSEYWFAIADAIKRSDKVQVHSFDDINEVIKYIKYNLVNKISLEKK